MMATKKPVEALEKWHIDVKETLEGVRLILLTLYCVIAHPRKSFFNLKT
jgi:hypothetical protein